MNKLLLLLSILGAATVGTQASAAAACYERQEAPGQKGSWVLGAVIKDVKSCIEKAEANNFSSNSRLNLPNWANAAEGAGVGVYDPSGSKIILFQTAFFDLNGKMTLAASASVCHIQFQNEIIAISNSNLKTCEYFALGYNYSYNLPVRYQFYQIKYLSSDTKPMGWTLIVDVSKDRRYDSPVQELPKSLAEGAR